MNRRVGPDAISFAKVELKQIQDEYDTIAAKYQKRMLEYSGYRYSNSLAQEFGLHGFTRRLRLLVRCINNVFSMLPPHQTQVPPQDDVSDAVINIQSFVFNTFGCTDNLAWIWVHEKNLDIRAGWVGLKSRNIQVRQTFSKQFQDYLSSLDSWFDHLENFRHALAHRIPLYIPPYVVMHGNKEAYDELETKIQEAILQMDFDKRDRLLIEQKSLCTFVPIITHSFQEGAHKIMFHAQIIANFNTIYELSGNFLDELSRQ